MKVIVKEWTPLNGGEKKSRYYVRGVDGSDYGFIEVTFKPTYPDLNTYYGRHRAAKGEGATFEVDKITLNGSDTVLAAIINLANKGRTAVENELSLMSYNADVFFFGDAKTVRAKKAAQKKLTIEL